MTTENENTNSNAPTPPPATGIHTDPVDAFKCAECGEIVAVEGLPSFSEIACPKCGAMASVPARLSNFLLLKLMGTGGMGGVYYARDEELGRFVAIKVMLESLGSDPAFIETFRREAQAVAKLNHPNIAQIYSYGQEKGQPYIVMELVSGERVDAMMDAPGGVKPALAMRIGLEIAQGLSAADEAGLVHGDIKPENILLDLKGQAKLVDFGLATVAHQAAGEGIWGTPYYIAPEKIRRQKVDARSDIYSLGATLFHILTGKPPFEGKTPVEVVKARLDVPPPDPSDHIPGLPDIVSTTIKRMLAVDRTARYPNYLSLISDLQKCVDEYGGIPDRTGKFKTGKHIRIKKRRSGGVSTVRTETPNTTGGSGRKVIIHKDGHGSGNTTTHTGTRSISIKSHKSSTPPPEPTPEEIAAREQRERRAKQKFWAILITIIILLAAAGGGTAWWFHHQEEIAKRKALFALSNARNQSIELFNSISNQVDRITKYSERADVFQSDILAAVERVTGSTIEIAAPEPILDPNTAATATNAVTNTVESSTNTVAEMNAESSEAGGDQSGDEASEAATEADEATGEAEADSGIIIPQPMVPDHPMVEPAHEGLLVVRDITELKLQADDMLLDASKLKEAIKTSALAVQAVADTANLRGIDEQITVMRNDTITRFERAEGLHQRVMAFRQEFDRAEEARIAAEKAAEEARLAAEKAERERQAYLARTAQEVLQAKSDRTDMKHFFDANNYEEALSQLKQRANNYQTEEGKAAFQVVFDRYEYLVRMKAALIKGMQTTRYSWGWGFGSASRDIESASEKGINVKGNAEPMPWSSVNTPQMLKLVDFYLSSNDLRARERIDIAFGAAIYCDMFGKQARERAQQYANRAMDLGLQRDKYADLIEAGWLTNE